MTATPAPSDRVAVIGSGIAGLAAAWLLARRYAVTLFEADPRLGGHSHTVDVTLEGVTAAVDTGFLVFNDRTYPNLTRLFEHIGVRSEPSDMSLSVRVDADGVEWSGSSLAGMFAQARNLLRPAFLAMLADIVRFNAHATALVRSDSVPAIMLGDLLERQGYSRAFARWYLLPMAAAIWSCPTGQVLRFPAATLLRFFHNHGLLKVTDRPRWRTVAGGARSYVARLAAGIRDVRRGTPVRSVLRSTAGAVEVVTETGGRERFGHAVLACHSDQSLALLADADPRERELLGAVGWQENEAVLHTDASFLPRSRQAWSAWNVHADGAEPGGQAVSLSYLINRLQPLPFRQPVIVTLNPAREPPAHAILARHRYAHPLLDQRAVRAQRELAAMQGQRRTWFCGAWTRYGFHEDGLDSAISVAAALGVRVPWHAEALAA